eukprot:TRINITY_DN5160_c0_g1_i8.p1 TRINITY_DN5160_c0_g1~~TRINITY_DN5160_c0_g1_i8.p1  ORF type:complete len:624 (-),score=132.25 TRINITY_DN5160_c0_g1_i8:52-1923(-)
MASGGEPSRIRRLLSTFILRRPPRQALVARGILHEEQAIVVPRRRTFIGRLQDIRREKNRANSQGSIMISKTKIGETPPPTSRPEGTSPGSSSPSPPPSQSFNAQWRIGTRQTGMRPNMMIGHVGSASSPNLLENIRIPAPLGSTPASVSAPHIAIAPSDVALASGPPVRIPPRPPPSRPLTPGATKSEPIPIEPTSAPSSPSYSETYSSSMPSSPSPSSTPTSPTLPRSPARPLPPRPGASSPPPIRPSPPSSPRPTLPSRPLPPSPLNRSTSFAGTNTIRPPTDISFNPSLPAPPAPRAPPPPPPPPPPTAPALKTPHPPTHPNPRKIRPPSKQIEMLTPPQFKQQVAPGAATQPTTTIPITITAKTHPTPPSHPPEVSLSASPPLPWGTPPMRIRSPSLASAPTTDYMKLDDLPTGGPIALQIADTITVSRVRSPSSARKYQPPKPAPPAPPPPPTPTHTFLDMDYVHQPIINQPNTSSSSVGAVKLKSNARLSLGFSQMETSSPPPPDDEAPPSPSPPSLSPPSPPALSPLPEVPEFPPSPLEAGSMMPTSDFIASPVSDQDQAASGDTYAPYALPGDPDSPEDSERTPTPPPPQLSSSADNTLSQFDEILFNINSSFS